MRIKETYRAWTAIIGALIIISGALFSDLNAGATEKNIDLTVSEFMDFVDSKAATGDDICDHFLEKETEDLWTEPTKNLKNWELLIWKDSGIAFWTGNQTKFDSAMLVRGIHVNRTIGGWDILVVKKKDDRTACAIYPLIRTPKGSVSGYSRLDNLSGLNFRLTENDQSKYWQERFNVALEFKNNKDTVRNINFFFWIGVILLFFSVVFWPHATIAWRLIIIGLAILFRTLLYKDIFYHSIRDSKIFDPEIYASSYLLPSLGDLTIHLLCSIVVVLHLGWIVKGLRTKNKIVSHLILWAILTSALFLTDMLHSIIKGLVLDSHISFDITNLSQINQFSLLAVVLITGALITIYYFLNLCVGGRDYGPLSWLSLFTLASIGFIAFQMIDGHARFSNLVPSVIMTLVFVAGLTRKSGRFWITSVSMAMIGSIFTIQAIQSNINKKEKELLYIYASKLIANKDIDAENKFLEIEKNLVSEFLKPEDFENFSQKKDQFEKRLRRLYFSGQLDRYDLKILNYDSVGNDLDKTNFINFDILNHLYNEHSYPTLSSYFYQIKDPSLQNSFVAKFENCDINGHYGNVFLLLQPKLIQSSYNYPSLLKRKMGSSLLDMEDHSYAIYNNDRLIQQKGNFSYPMRFNKSDLNKNTIITGYKHFTFEQNDNSKVLISYPNRNLLIYSSGFIFLLLFNLALIFASLVIIASLYKWHIKRLKRNERHDDYRLKRSSYDQFISFWGFEQPLLRTRIQFAMIAVVSLGLLISVYVTIKYVEFNYNDRIEDELIFNLKEVSNHLQNEVNTDQKITDPELRLQLINQISNIYKLETNIFGTDGSLLGTSGPELYNEGILSSFMDHNAYRALKINGASQYIHKEWIRQLSYLSAYVPILDEQRQVIAYLNLPYFTQQKELDKDISAYTLTLVNVYILLFLLALILAYLVSARITKPLKLIREKIAITTLGHKNEMLDWKSNDEIGQLIRQYNKMVLELEESARKLSDSEREGAWKEMARQVAHEIKNPLTPMKLNIQHLQRTWSDKSPNLEDTFERVTKVLIEQIDSLSRLSSEFSSFAQMPQVEFTPCSIRKVLSSTIYLFEKSENIDLESVLLGEETMVYADEEQLSRAFSNVIKNAIQSIPEERKGHIAVHMEIDEGQVVIRISDNGSGIPKDEQKKIFVPNFSTKTSGMGLGLAITKKIIETTGGSISFVTEKEKGTTFTIKLPVYKG